MGRFSKIPPVTVYDFYEQISVYGRNSGSVRNHLYVLFPKGLGEAAILEQLHTSVQAWTAHRIGRRVDEQHVISTSGGKSAAQSRAAGGTFGGKKRSQTAAAGTTDGFADPSSDPSSKVALGA